MMKQQVANGVTLIKIQQSEIPLKRLFTRTNNYLIAIYTGLIVVDSLSDTTISGVLLRVYFLNSVSYSCSDEFAFFWGSHVFIESIGFLGYPTPYLNAGGYDGEYPGQLKCYENDVLGLVQFIAEPCDFLETGIVQMSHPELRVFPNPTHTAVQIHCGSGEVQEILIFNALGQHQGHDYS